MSLDEGKRKAKILDAPRDDDDDDDKVASGSIEAESTSALEHSGVMKKETESESESTENPPLKKARKSDERDPAAARKDDDAKPSDTTKSAGSPVIGSTPTGTSTLSDYEKCSIFPQKLMQLLKNEEAPEAIWWLEDGESFAIEPEQFTKVMNKVSRTSKKKVKLDSILRNLYRWGFKKLKDRDLPPNVLAYSHPKFKRDASVELQTFSKKAEPAPPAAAAANGMNAPVPPPSALARALSARAQQGYGDSWNEEGAADKTTLPMQPNNPFLMGPAGSGAGGLPGSLSGAAFSSYPYLTGAGAYPGGVGAGFEGAVDAEQRMMFQSMMFQQQQQQQRQMLLQQELRFHNERQRHLLLEAAAAERAAAQQYAAHRLGSFPFPPSSGGYPF